jgi:methyl-accepting chemotaxis protein
VVADEVRKLSERSRSAAADITDLTGKTVNNVQSAGQSLETLVPEVEKTSELVQDISATSKEQSSGADQISKAVQQLDQVIQGNASAAEELASTSEELESQADTLANTIEFFRTGTVDGSEVAGVNFAAIRFSHLQWKSRLRAYLDGERSISRDEALSERDCALGQWYYGPGMEQFGHLDVMQRLEEPHRRLHELVPQIMDLADRGQMSEANERLNELEPLSERIVNLLHELEQTLREQ